MPAPKLWVHGRQIIIPFISTAAAAAAAACCIAAAAQQGAVTGRQEATQAGELLQQRLQCWRERHPAACGGTLAVAPAGRERRWRRQRRSEARWWRSMLQHIVFASVLDCTNARACWVAAGGAARAGPRGTRLVAFCTDYNSQVVCDAVDMSAPLSRPTYAAAAATLRPGWLHSCTIFGITKCSRVGVRAKTST